ncbi:helix-turn-helix domain-containing protein [Nostoc favosum]|uniref:Helix-turn-helix domain-containing protein n=1 Tax=Nostoc favosum CHAB5714 TaxID=2780399 RepID=A0ABS8ICF4_9NOSO|nr:helix-turn-helix domain-containing protein [Nostoc favosum]MCC5601586.1 helix-turn-helix domain-containing protein [Nostoc favosum CHAB5714]
MVSSKQISDRQQTSLALQTTNAALESKVQELLTKLNDTNEQLCCEKTLHQRTQTELEKSLSLLQAALDATADGVIAISFLTAKNTKTEVHSEMQLGEDNYLSKPSTVEELLRAIAARLEKQAAQKEWYAAETQQSLESESTEIAKSVEPQSLLPSDPHLREVFEFIEANYHQPMGLTDVAQAVGYSAAYLTDLVRRQTGETVHKWIAKRRMAAACSLLLETNQSIEQIAEAVGYRYAGCLFRQFRISFGMTPQVWRKAQILIRNS